MGVIRHQFDINGLVGVACVNLYEKIFRGLSHHCYGSFLVPLCDFFLFAPTLKLEKSTLKLVKSTLKLEKLNFNVDKINFKVGKINFKVGLINFLMSEKSTFLCRKNKL